MVISLSRNRSSLALGNVVGSTISNILGAFSLGLLFRRNPSNGTNSPLFDRSSTFYTIILLLITGLASGILAFDHGIKWRAAGGTFIGLFALYISSIAYLIAKGLSTAPQEVSDSESDSDDEAFATRDEAAPSANIRTDVTEATGLLAPMNVTTDASRTTSGVSRPDSPIRASIETMSTCGSTTPIFDERHKRRGLAYHIALLAAGFVAVILSSYVLSTAATNLVDQFHISESLFGVIVLSIATTIPEKFIAALSGYKGHMGIMVANTVGSNVFLLTLCLGIVWISTDGKYEGGYVKPAEIAVMFGSAVVMAVTILLRGRYTRIMGVLMLTSYIAFIILDFTVIHRGLM